MSRKKRVNKENLQKSSVKKRAKSEYNNGGDGDGSAGDAGADIGSSSRGKHNDDPVQVQKIDYSKNAKSKVPSIPLAPDLKNLLYPLSPDVFFSTILRKKALHVTCEKGFEEEHAKTRVTSLCKEMYNLDTETLLRETSSDNVFLWLRGRENNNNNNNSINKNDSKNGKRAPIRSIEIADPATAWTLHNTAGHATYCRAPPKVEQNLVASLLRATGLGCGQYDPSGDSIVSLGRGEVETFISTDGHVTDWHFDFQENFTIQLSGTKRWTLQQGVFSDPIRGCTPHYAAPEAVESQLKAAHLFDRKFKFGFPETGVTAKGNVMSIDVKPGDVFYFPAGMWHKVETIVPGISINVSLMAANYATVTCQALQQILYKDERWRQPVMNNAVSNPVQHLKTLLKDLPSMIKTLESHGAESIIPPIIQHPPSYQTIEEDDEDEGGDFVEESPSDEDENSNTDQEKGSDKDDQEVTAEEDDDEDDDAESGNIQIEEDEMDETVDPKKFDDYPAGWKLEIKPGSRVGLLRNSLAALHQLSEITSFYDNDPECHDGVYVLNVNYAGNEMHQSVVRVVFNDNENKFVEKLYDWERSYAEKPMNITIAKEDISHLKFLVFHGYLHVVK